MPETSTAVLVLGMHRSGTSVLTRALHALGVYLGEELQPGAAYNPKGYFEDIDVVRISEELLSAAHARWDSLLVGEVPESLSVQLRTRAAALIAERFGASPLWGFKDPRVTRFQPFWHSVISQLGVEPVYVLANRHPLSVAASLVKRDAMPQGKALALWALHQLAGLDAIARYGGLVVEYDELLQAPETQLARLASFLRRPFDSRNPEVAAFIERFLDVDLRNARHVDGAGETMKGELGALCRDIHAHIGALSALDPTPGASLAAQGQSLLERGKAYFNAQAEWLSTVDLIAVSLRDTTERYNHLADESKKRIALLQGELTSMRQRKSYKAYVAIRNALLAIKDRTTRRPDKPREA